MFIQLTQLIQQANMAKVILQFEAVSEGRYSIVLHSQRANGEVPNPELRQALSIPLHVEGSLTELEESFTTHLMQFCEAKKVLTLYANTETVSNSAASAKVKANQNPDGGQHVDQQAETIKAQTQEIDEGGWE